MKKCSIDGCSRPHTAKGFCKVHYMRNKRKGSPHWEPLTEWEKIEARILPVPECGCWLWTGPANPYGSLERDGKTIRAHRYIYEILKGPIPKGVHVLHKCDTPSCVNPEHLFLGTQKDNIQDMFSKVRQVRYAGEKHWGAKITNEQAIKIYKAKKAGVKTRILIKKYGLSQSSITAIARGEQFKQAVISFMEGENNG